MRTWCSTNSARLIVCRCLDHIARYFLCGSFGRFCLLSITNALVVVVWFFFRAKMVLQKLYQLTILGRLLGIMRTAYPGTQTNRAFLVELTFVAGSGNAVHPVGYDAFNRETAGQHIVP